MNAVKGLERELTGRPPSCFMNGMAGARRQREIPFNPRSLAAIGQRLIDTRKALAEEGASQSAWAAKAGIAKNTYNQYENGVSRPRLDEAIMLCDCYQLSLDWIYLGRREGLPLQIAQRIPRSAE